MQRHLAPQRAGIGTVVLLSALIGLGAVDRAQAQAGFDPYGFKVLGDAIQALQQSVNTLQAKVDALQHAVQPRQFYLTTNSFDGSHAETACASGFHMASLWEIFDTSTLVYNTTLGKTQADSGSGPPSGVIGWIRTGSVANDADVMNHAGIANCNGYTENDGTKVGTVANLQAFWGAPPGSPTIAPWDSDTLTCNDLKPVWCVQS